MAFTNRYVKILPTGTMERFIAYGFKHYGDTVIMGNANQQESIYASGIIFSYFRREFRQDWRR
jgi:hypothetical protein